MTDILMTFLWFSSKNTVRSWMGKPNVIYFCALLNLEKCLNKWWILNKWWMTSVQFSSVTQSCLTLCDPMNRSTPGLPVHHQLPEFTQTHVHWVSDAIQPSHPRLSPSPPAPSPSQYQGLFQRVNSSHEVAKYWSFSISIIPSKEHPGLISFRIRYYYIL